MALEQQATAFFEGMPQGTVQRITEARPLPRFCPTVYYAGYEADKPMTRDDAIEQLVVDACGAGIESVVKMWPEHLQTVVRKNLRIKFPDNVNPEHPAVLRKAIVSVLERDGFEALASNSASFLHTLAQAQNVAHAKGSDPVPHLLRLLARDCLARGLAIFFNQFDARHLQAWCKDVTGEALKTTSKKAIISRIVQTLEDAPAAKSASRGHGSSKKDKTVEEKKAESPKRGASKAKAGKKSEKKSEKMSPKKAEKKSAKKAETPKRKERAPERHSPYSLSKSRLDSSSEDDEKREERDSPYSTPRKGSTPVVSPRPRRGMKRKLEAPKETEKKRRRLSSRR